MSAKSLLPCEGDIVTDLKDSSGHLLRPSSRHPQLLKGLFSRSSPPLQLPFRSVQEVWQILKSSPPLYLNLVTAVTQCRAQVHTEPEMEKK
jgi:hypothetical protein